MSKFQRISTRYRGVYDGNTLYYMFDEVDDGSLAGRVAAAQPLCAKCARVMDLVRVST
jgi:hypothetical protein